MERQINEPVLSGNTMMKQPWKAVFLTGLFTGAGHIYAGARSRGYFLVALTVVLHAIMLGSVACFLAFQDQGLARASMLVAFAALSFVFAIHILAFFDSYKIARRFNKDQNPEADATGKKKAWLSVFLSNFFPGIGQFYNGQVLKGIAFVAATWVLLAGEELYYQLFFVLIALQILSLKDAFDSAEKRNGSSERFLDQGNALLVFITVIVFFNAIPLGLLIKDNFLKAYKIPAGSMLPTLEIGDRLLIDKTKATLEALQPGDIVVFPHPENPEKSFIKRVIALSGDKVQFINGDLYLNDKLVQKQLIKTIPNQGNLPAAYPEAKIYAEHLGDQDYRIQYMHGDLASYNSGPFIVPQNSVFVLGDNRDNSQDSRVWGSVPRDTIEGKALKIYWSWNWLEGKVNWDRIGQMIY